MKKVAQNIAEAKRIGIAKFPNDGDRAQSAELGILQELYRRHVADCDVHFKQLSDRDAIELSK